MQNFANLPIIEQGTVDNSGLTRGYGMVRCIYMGVIRRITKRNGSIQLNLPMELREALNLDVGDFIFIEMYDGNKILMRKIDVVNNPSLRRLLPAGDPAKYDEPRD